MIIKIDEKYDVILTFSPINEITGHIFECFDYYLFLRNYFKVGILFLGSIGEEKLKNVFNDKYIVDFDDIRHDIIIVPENELKTKKMYTFGKNTVVILCDGNIHQLQLYGIHLITRKLLGFLCAEKEESYVDKISMYKHITYLKDYRIYSNNNYFKSYNYVKKLPFQYYKKSNRVFDNTGMMYVTFACRKITPAVIKEYHEMSGCKKTLLVVPYKLSEYDNIDDVEQIEAPLSDFFNRFDTYIYTPVQRKFDCSPRLVTECFLHNKQIMLNVNYVDLGLQTRYNDCKQDLNNVNLQNNDKIIDIINEIRTKN
jgi:hypothetical protein